MPDAFNDPAMSRARTRTDPSDTVEMRFDVSSELANRIDAMLMVDGHKSRQEYLVPLIEKAINSELHRATVLLRCAGINPFDSAGDGKESGK